ncbi:terpene synthase family protein [Streptomyces stramineus]
MPVPVRPHAHADQVVRGVEAWLWRVGLFEVEEYRRVYRNLRLGEVFSTCHPTGNIARLIAIAPAYMLAFFADNPQTGDEHASEFLQGMTGGLLGLTPPQVIKLIADPGIDAFLTSPLAKAFLAANRPLRATTSPGKYECYITRFLEWFGAESRHAAQSRRTLDEALRHRLVTAGMPVVAAYTAIAYPELTEEDARSREAAAVWELSALTTAMHNDLYSGYTELYRDGELRPDSATGGNTIPAFAHEYGITIHQAAQRVAELADRAIAEAVRRVHVLARQQAPAVLIDYLNTALAYPATALSWYPQQMTGRYRSPGLDLSSVTVTQAPRPAATGAPGITCIDHLWNTDTTHQVR